jgi:putative transcriptional regulator
MTMSVSTAKAAGHEAPAHHLSDELLLDYAAGSLDEATSLLVAAHLTYCADCRARAAELEALGGSMLEDLPAVDMSAGALDCMLATLDGALIEPAVQRARPANDNPVLPRVVQRYVGGDVEAVTWKRLGMGVETARIEIPGSDLQTFLLKVPEGKAVPQHTHAGNEYVLILDGAYTDESGRFAKGDVAISDGDVDHRPVAEAGRDCLCLVVMDAPIRLSGPMGPLFNLFVKV